MASFLTGILYGGFGMFIGMTMLLLVIFFIDFSIKRRNNRLFKITYVNAGKEEIEWRMGSKKKHGKLGDCYYIPSLKKEGRCYMPFWGSEYEYSVSNYSKKKYVPVTFIKGDYIPEAYKSTEEVEMEVIELVEKEIDGETKQTYEKFKKKVVRNIVTPTKSSMRQFVLAADKVTDEEYNVLGGWFARHGHLIVAASIVFICAVVSIMMIVFSYQAGVDGAFQTTPDWARPILDMVTSNAAPPSTP